MMSLRSYGSLLVLVTALAGCDSIGPPAQDGADAFPEDPEPQNEGFDGVLTGTASLPEGLDPALLRVGSFPVRSTAQAVLANGDLAERELSLQVRLGEGLEVSPDDGGSTGDVDHFSLRPMNLADLSDDANHAWHLRLPSTGASQLLVIAWVDEDGDGLFDVSPDGTGIEPGVIPQKRVPSVAPDFRMMLEGVWEIGFDTWDGNAAGSVDDGTFHEEPIAIAGTFGWECPFEDAAR